ncbi:nicotinate-nucleotide adenylyltransferase [Synechococcus elongatus IITB4]|uniref:nicotinate-nucleotide adenylyltransferase n=1 Tax=Synechococcus elongatus TaxID=32046 RepID=UPI0030CD70B4
MRLALFGTSADPPTLAHQAIIQGCADCFDHVAIWASDNPFKQHAASLRDRSQMLAALVNDCQPPLQNAQVYADLSFPRTIQTLTVARDRWPQAELSLVIGSDLLAQIPRWYQAAQWLPSVSLFVVPRPDSNDWQAAADRLMQQGTTVAIAPFQGPAIASSTFRESGDWRLLPAAVTAYIHHHQLYSSASAAL